MRKPTEEEEKKMDSSVAKYASYKQTTQASDKSIGSNSQKENKPGQNEILTRSINKEEKEEQLKNLLHDLQDLKMNNKPKLPSQKSKQDNSDEETFEEDEGHRVYAKYKDLINLCSKLLKGSSQSMEKKYLDVEKKTQYHTGNLI